MCRCAEPRRPVSGVREALRMPRDRSADAVNAATVTPCRRAADVKTSEPVPRAPRDALEARGPRARRHLDARAAWARHVCERPRRAVDSNAF